MSAKSQAEGQLTLGDAHPPMPPFRVGDFAEVSEKKHVLRWCPLCVLDGSRPPYRFAQAERRDVHFHHEHGPDDVGRPMAELLPGGAPHGRR